MGATRFNETALSLAVNASKSLRTTIVAFVADKLKLKAGDSVGWQLNGKTVRLDRGGSGYVSKVIRAQTSYRTTVPQQIVNALQIGQKDVLVWDVDKECKGKVGRWYATLRKK